MRPSRIAHERSDNGRGLAILLGFVVLMLALASFVFREAIIYNGSNSMPIGFYVRAANEDIRVGAVVTAYARTVSPEYAEARAFVDPTDRFIKWVAADTGDEVCAQGQQIIINGVPAVRRAMQDGAGRTLPRWDGCVTLDANHVFLLGETPDSFDGRYWGPIDRQDIEAVWRPL